MARYVTKVRTARSADEAFAYMADLRHFAEWDPGVKKVVQVEGEAEQRRHRSQRDVALAEIEPELDPAIAVTESHGLGLDRSGIRPGSGFGEPETGNIFAAGELGQDAHLDAGIVDDAAGAPRKGFGAADVDILQYVAGPLAVTLENVLLWEEATRRLASPDRLTILRKPFDATEALQLAESVISSVQKKAPRG